MDQTDELGNVCSEPPLSSYVRINYQTTPSALTKRLSDTGRARESRSLVVFIMVYDPKVTSKNSKDSQIPLDEELRGLLSDADNEDLPQYDEGDHSGARRRPLHKKKIAAIAAGLVTCLLGASLFRPLYRHWCNHYTDNQQKLQNQLLSNGTHEFKRTVLIVSIDGLRWGKSPTRVFTWTLMLLQSGLPRSRINSSSA
jgi:hypothetical protein